MEEKAAFFDHFLSHLDKIRNKKREFIFCGNWATAHNAIDVANADQAAQQSGFLPQEQAWMEQLTNQLGYVDAFREVNRDNDEFTSWPDGRNQDGSRIDYQIVSAGLQPTIEYGFSFKSQSFSSHTPVIIDYDIELS
jgi:exodeoxyribonuclease-3